MHIGDDVVPQSPERRLADFLAKIGLEMPKKALDSRAGTSMTTTGPGAALASGVTVCGWVSAMTILEIL